MLPRISSKRALVPGPSAFLAKHGLPAKAPFVPPTRTSRALLEPPSPTPPSEPIADAPAKKTPSDALERGPEGKEPELLDSATRASILLAPPTSASAASSPAPASTAASTARMAEAQALACAMVERASFWGDGTRGLARLRFGTNARLGLSGATVVLEHDGDKIALRIEDGEDASATAKLVERLRARGLNVDD